MSDLIQWPRAKYWTGTFNPVVGCRPVSEGCQNCYASSVCKRYDMNGDGQFNPTPKPNARLPRNGVVFVGNMTDIFGEWNTDQQINNWMYSLSVEAVNLILTKRHNRLDEYFTFSESIYDDRPFVRDMDHLWFGVTAENQKRLDERGYLLMKSGVRRKWISLEPLLEPLNIAPWLLTEHQKRGFDNQYIAPKYEWQYHDKLDWVVVGAESIGNRAGRECRLEWVENIVEDCMEWGVPVFVKQLHIGGKLVKDINKFPEHLRIRQVPWYNQ